MWTSAAPCPPPSDAPAKDEQQARSLFEQALRLEPGAPEQALELLQCADGLAPKPAVALRIGTIAERLGQRELAASAFQNYLNRAGDEAPDAAQIRTRIAELRAAPDGEPNETAPAGTDDGAPQVIAGWVLVGTGAALAVAGAVLLGVAKSTSDDVHDLAPGTTYWTDDEAQGKLETAQTEQSIGIVGLVSAGTLAALGAVLLATLPEPSPVAVSGTLGPRGWVMTLAFEL